TALVVLSTADLKNFWLAFPLVIRTPGDLQDFVAILKSGSLRKGYGRGVKKAVSQWMNNISEYHVIKYGSQGAKFSLRDILRLTHPKPTSQRQHWLFSYLCNGLTEDNGKAIGEMFPQIRCMELLKEETNLEKQKALITEGRLPFDTVVGAIKPNRELWTELMHQMPYMALLKNLNTLARADVFKTEGSVEYVVGRVTDEKGIRGSKILPFRLYTAYQYLDSSIPIRVKEALVTALEISFQNTPMLNGLTAVGCDVSSSMTYNFVSEKSKTRCIDIAAIFSATMLKKNEDAQVFPFSTVLKPFNLSRRDSLMTITNTLARLGGGGTNVALPIQHLLANRIKVDNFIGITDNEDWAGPGFLVTWRQYLRTVNPNAKAFLLHTSPYKDAVAPKSEPNVFFFYGWSDKILPFIAMTANGGTTQLDAVRATNLTVGLVPTTVDEEKEE
ncbi:MAG TPA: TROVE domain-containing protein, partial [Methylomirabilota bacterium]|nr:TROVE domain-containing protein [Methylomirabilota bacterium]